MNNLYIWETECSNCASWSGDEIEKITPDKGTIVCSACEGFSFNYYGRRITGYCQYNIGSNIRYSNDCPECKIHFDYVQEKVEINKKPEKSENSTPQ